MKSEYIKIPNSLFNYDLKPVAFKVIVTLYSEFFMTDSFAIRYAILADKCGISCSSVKRAVAELVSKGLLEKQIRYDYMSHKQISNKYTLHRESGKYFTIEKSLLNVRLDNYQLMLLCAVKRRSNAAGMAFPSLNKLVKDTGMSKTTVIKHIRTLTEQGYLNKSNYIAKAGDFGNNNYRVWGMCFRFILLWLVNKMFIVSLTGTENKVICILNSSYSTFIKIELHVYIVCIFDDS